MKVVEQFIQSKTPNPDECEDGIFLTEHFAAVVDGATSKTGKMYDGKKTGRIARDLVLEALATLAPETDARTAMHTLNGALNVWYELHGVTELMRTKPAERCSASVIMYSVHQSELWMVGDCQALIGGVHHIDNSKFIDQVSDNARAAFIEAELRAGKTVAELQAHDTGRDFIMPILERQNYFQNVAGGTDFDYEVIDGFFTDSLPIRIEHVDSGSTELVLASDGYPVLQPTLAESEAELATTLAEDPLLYTKHRSPKGLMAGNVSYDDRAYVRLVL
jgi:glycerophosphoryl diester phosphodiesterase